ncbi:MAG: DivIVA domain-containing protein [Actinobacteria bacterium]|nr:MAG: DivIVA domain-containing protein [Actinomycetota bacterium]
MALTPVEIRHVRLGRGLFGYGRAPTDRVLEEIVSSFEEVWRDRADLADKVEQLESDLERFRELEALLRSTLVSAERTAAELKTQAMREADLIVEEARAEARSIVRQAAADNERLEADSARIRALLRAALATIEASDEDEDDVEEDARPAAA